MRILVVDDHPLTRMGASLMLGRMFPGVAVDEGQTIAEALELFETPPRPELVILDLNLPDATGTEGVSRMVRRAGEVPVLVFSQNTESVFAGRLLQMGVAGFLPKDLAATEFETAVQRVLSGRRYVSPAMADHLLGMLEGRAPTALPHEQLSTQEYRVMLMIAGGRTPAEIADTMHLSVKTVGSYRARILAKLGWKNNIELTKYCVQHGLTSG